MHGLRTPYDRTSSLERKTLRVLHHVSQASANPYRGLTIWITVEGGMPNAVSVFTNSKRVVGTLQVNVRLISKVHTSRVNGEDIVRLVRTEDCRSVA